MANKLAPMQKVHLAHLLLHGRIFKYLRVKKGYRNPYNLADFTTSIHTLGTHLQIMTGNIQDISKSLSRLSSLVPQPGEITSSLVDESLLIHAVSAQPPILYVNAAS